MKSRLLVAFAILLGSLVTTTVTPTSARAWASCDNELCTGQMTGCREMEHANCVHAPCVLALCE